MHVFELHFDVLYKVDNQYVQNKHGDHKFIICRLLLLTIYAREIFTKVFLIAKESSSSHLGKNLTHLY